MDSYSLYFKYYFYVGVFTFLVFGGIGVVRKFSGSKSSIQFIEDTYAYAGLGYFLCVGYAFSWLWPLMWITIFSDILNREKLQQERQAKLHEEARLRETEARRLWNQYHSISHKGTHVSEMTGKEFERFVAALYSRMGYQVEFTPNGADQGADLIIHNSDESAHIAVQAKRWKKNVGNAAVQEVMAAMSYYECGAGIVITNSGFTAAARSLARSNRSIELVDGDRIRDLVHEFGVDQVPAFSWGAFERKELDIRRFCE